MHITDFKDEIVLRRAAEILQAKIKRTDAPVMSNPTTVKQYLQYRLVREDREGFFVLYLDTKHRLIHAEILFAGGLDGCEVQPRIVLKRALEHNAAAILIAHNHPSGLTQPSEADKRLTRDLRDTLALIDVRLLDHFIVGNDVLSFAEKGLL